MSVIDFSNFFSTLPTRVSFSLKRRSDMPSALCWFNPKQSEGYFPEPEEILRAYWKVTNQDLKAFSAKGRMADLTRLMEGFCPLSTDDTHDGDTMGIAVGKDSSTGEWLHVFQSQFEGVMCIGSVKESQFLHRVRSFYLLSKVIDMPTVDHNDLGDDSSHFFFYSDEAEPWHTEFIRGKDMRDAQAKAASFLATRSLRQRTWAVCMQVFGEELYATLFPKVDEKGHSDSILHHIQENIGALASVCPPVQVILFWRE
jgi:hypothetical protein